MTNTNTSIIVHGASGRLGSRICAIALADPSITLAGAITHPGSSRLGHGIVGDAPSKSTIKYTIFDDQRADVVIDFSSDDGARRALEIALASRAALLVGTTALSSDTVETLRAASKKISVLLAPNTSLGVAVLAESLARVARALGPGYDISIVEAHHNKKKDAPSGTALRLARASEAAGFPLKPDQIVAIRGGDVVGEHTVRFAGTGEYIELTHRATTRDVFAHGAIRAAKWLAHRPAGWHTMEDVLGLSAS